MALLLQTTKALARSCSFYVHTLHQSCDRKMSTPKKTKIEGSDVDKKKERLVWVDLEMTGLDVEKERIIEIACIVTSGDLDIIAEGPNLVIHQPDSVLDNMGDWCKQHHGQSGLTQAVRNSKISTSEAEDQVLKFVQQHTKAGCAPLAGNSVHADRMFLRSYMPAFLQHLHYRIVDVSTVKELCRRWYPEEYRRAPKKALGHRALDDIKESIKELQYYRQAIFKSSGKSASFGDQTS